MAVEKRANGSKRKSLLISTLRAVGLDRDLSPTTARETSPVKAKTTAFACGRHTPALPEDVLPIRNFLIDYSGISGEDVDQHVYRMRDRLWDIYPHACVSRFRFASLSFATDAYYQAVLNRLLQASKKKSDGKLRLLDVGCCVGQVLRKLTLDGVDSSRLYGLDIEPRFLEIGYELFQDRDKFRGTFLVGDPLAPGDGDPRLGTLDGKMTFIHAGSFFHLFTWNDQLRVATRMVRFLDTTQRDIMIFGRHVGTMLPRENGMAGSDKVYLHNADSWQKLWNEVGERTGTKWKATMTPTGTIENAGGAESSLRKMTFCVIRA
ncbi:hypothetical protein GGS21DRAFT_512382 [Xylaria nigripes]|nr:hypothetical protein GGS21DRAFT_512382 [Xylaria nigripes]